MSLVLDELPSDPDRLLLMLQQMAEVIAQHNASLASLQAERDAAQTRYEVAQAEIEKLWLLIRQLQRGQFGRRSERLGPDQLQLGLEDLEQTAAAAEAAQEATAASHGTPQPARTRRRNLGALPAHLPRVEVLVDVEDKSCPCCGGALHAISEDTSEMLDLLPAQLRVKVIRRPRYACRACEEAVVQAPAPERPISGGMATEALLAHVLVAKYGDFLPLYRHVWMAPVLQGKSLVTRGGGRLRSCVRPLWCGRRRPLALMGSAGRGLIKRPGTSRPAADTRLLPTRRLDRLTPSRRLSLASSGCRSRGGRSPVLFSPHQHRPGDPRELVGERHRDHQAWLPGQQAPDPGVLPRLPRPAQHRVRADDELPAQVGVA